ncbi:MAG: type II CRISPR RNA-guided endonuclease Cas9 [Candidatus Pacearchaeota archaeon]
MTTKKILGLDLGIASIGWALISENESERKIIALGTRVIPLDKEESDEFSSGNKITKNQNRTIKRTQRKVYYRYVLRRKALTAELKKRDMFDENLFKLSQLELWELRAKAVSKKISLKELGRVLYHLNQKRGYKAIRVKSDEEKKEKEFVIEVQNRYEMLKAEGKTIGQKFLEELLKNPHYRTKQQVFPREAYIEEFLKIMKKQQEFYPEVLTDEFINHLKNDIIYYQRKLKSQKGLVNICNFEGFYVKNEYGKEIFVGPRVAHRSNPIFQVERIWETINNISIKNKFNEELQITIEQKRKIFEYLDSHEKLTQPKLFELLGIKEKSSWIGNKMISKGLQGNLTKVWIKKAINNQKKYESLLKFELNFVEKDEEAFLIDAKTGEVKNSIQKKIVSENFAKEPLYLLWHTIYSISDIEECKRALIKNFGFDEETAERLAKIDFNKLGYGNKSVKAIRKILPYLMEGYKYSEAASFAGYNHSSALTRNDRLSQRLLDKIPLLQKNSLRQPVVEKILNQMIHIVNEIIDEKRGWVTKEEREKGLFEIRVELARELKQSKEERKETFNNLSKIERENKEIEKRLIEMDIRATRKNIIKYRLFNEVATNKLNAMCIYTGKVFSLTDALTGNGIDVDHIIPITLLFDDSQSNKVLTFSYVNSEKGNLTAYDYMAKKGEEELKKFIERVNYLYKEKIISKAKRDKLLTPSSKIPKDMIARQLRETQYVARKSKEILELVCKNVWTTTGSITAYLRRLWGWDDILMNLQITRIKKFIPNPLEEGITEIIELKTDDGQVHKKEFLKNWNKRLDHRNHAIDALVVACTKQGYIQRINTLSSQHIKEELFEDVKNQNLELRLKLSLLDKYFISQKPFSTKEIEQKVAEILISYKPGKKVATYGKRFIVRKGKKIVVQKNIIVPRGPLSEESIYGKIKVLDFNKPIDYLFMNPDLIFKEYIRNLVQERLEKYNNNVNEAIKSLNNDPIYLDKDKKVILEYATCFKEEYVIKYPLKDIKAKDVKYIVDKKVRELVSERLKEFNYNENEAFKEHLYFNEEKKIPIRTVRMLTGLSAVEPIKRDSSGNIIGFVKPGNNHHIAIYLDEKRNKRLHLCTFWHAVERKKYGIPVIIDNPNNVWNKILNDEKQYPDNFLEKLPEDKWTFIMSFQQNEMFLLGIIKENENLKEYDKEILSNYLFRVQKLFYNGKQLEIYFRHHLETQLDDSQEAKKSKRFYAIKSLRALEELNPIKVRINRLGEIII